MTPAPPPRLPRELVVRLVEAFARNWPDLKPPICHADDVLPLLQGDDREFAAASVLLDSDRVFYPNGKP